MKSKILSALKTKYKNIGFSDKAFESVSEFLEPTITDEAQIDNSIAGVESLLKSFQSEADARVTKALAESRKENKPKQEKEGEPAKKDDTPTNNEPPEYVKQLTDLVTALTQKVTAFESDKMTTTRRSQLEAKLAQSPESVKNKVLKDFSRMNFNTDEDFDSYLTETEEDIKTLNQEVSNQSLANIPKPLMSVSNKDGVSTDTAQYIASLTGKQENSFEGKNVFENLKN